MALLVIAIGALLVWRDAWLNSAPLRQLVKAEVYAQTGRELTLTGDLRVPGFAATGAPWLLLEVGAGELGNPVEYQGPPLLAWNSLSVTLDLSSWRDEQLRWGPLLIEGARLEAGFDAQGRDNFSDLGPVIDSAPAQTEWEMPSVRVQRGSIRYHDLSQDPALEIHWDELDLQLTQLRQGALERSERWSLQGAIGSGRLSRHPFAPAPLQTALPLRVSSAGVDIDFAAATLQTARLQVELGAASVVLTDWRLEFPAAQSLRLSSDIVIRDLALPAWLDSLEIALPKAVAATTTLLRLESLSATLHWRTEESATHLVIDPLSMQVDETRLQGRLSLNPGIGLELAVDRIDLDRYLPLFDAGAPASGGDPEILLQNSLAALRALPLNGSCRIADLQVAGHRLRGINLTFHSRIDSK